jgi:hypothetical protein
MVGAKLSQSERSFVVDIFFPNRPEPMPQKKNCRHYQPNTQTDQEKPAIGGERDQKNAYHDDGNDKTRYAAESGSGLSRLKIRFHTAPRRCSILKRSPVET